MGLNDRIIQKMIAYEKGCPQRIQHFLKVFEFSHLIAEEEKIDPKVQEILELAAIVHDIGIKPGLERFGSGNGKIQEEIGPDYAREFFADIPELPREYLDRICYLIAHHHTYKDVDGMDYRILIEADFLVNAFEENLKMESIKNVREEIFRTRTGRWILDTMFSVE